MAKKRDEALGGEPEFRVVNAAFFAKDGTLLRRWDGFTVGRDQVGHGLSMGMGAALFVDPDTGEVIRKWNPWGVLGE